MKNSTKLLWSGAIALLLFTLIFALVVRYAVIPLAPLTDTSAVLTVPESPKFNVVKSRIDGGQEEQKELGVGQTLGLDIKDFDALSSSGSWDITVVQGNSWVVDVESPYHTGIEIRVEKNGSTLNLVDNNLGKPGHYDGTPVVVRITIPMLVRVDGAGSLKFKAQDISARELKFAGAGSGEVTVTGKVKSLDLDVSGAWNFTGGGLYSEDIRISVSGSGSVSLGARDSDVQGQISGAVNVVLYGNPRSQGIQASGISSVQVR